MAMSKSTKYLAGAIVCLVIVCIGLIIGLVTTKNQHEDVSTNSRRYASNDNKFPNVQKFTFVK